MFKSTSATRDDCNSNLSHIIQVIIIDLFSLSLFVLSLVARIVKNPPTVQEILVQSLGQEDPLEKRMATHSSILAWRIPWTVEPGGL